jgi:aminomethyltransferase
MKSTALKEKHLELGAKMVAFAGYEMPLQYAGLLPEHHAVRQKAGIFDVSHMGEFFISGPQAFDLLQFATSNDVSKLSPGKIQYSCLPNDQGGIVDDLLVYQMDENRYMLVVNASNIEKDWERLKALNEDFGAEMENRSDSISLLAVQGPKAIDVLQGLTETDLSQIPYYTFKIGSLAGISDVIISNTGYTGAGGFELYISNEDAPTLWDAILEAGSNVGLIPAGLGARDTLRMEMGFCLYGNDIDDGTSPLEAGLGWITKLDTNFVNSTHLKEQKAAGLQKKLVGFRMLDRGIPRHGYPIQNSSGEPIGEVRSGTQSPTLEKAIGMGYVSLINSNPGTRIWIEVRGKALEAEVVKLPFI